MTTTNYYQITEAQLNACQRLINASDEVYYHVTSASDADTEYTVSFDKGHGVLTCTCKAGQEGMGCWHKRAAVAHSNEYKAEQATIAAYEAQEARIARLQLFGLTRKEADLAVSEASKWVVAGQPINDETLARVYCSHQYPTAAEADLQAADALRNDTRRFSLLK